MLRLQPGTRGRREVRERTRIAPGPIPARVWQEALRSRRSAGPGSFDGLSQRAGSKEEGVPRAVVQA
eukprot:5476703-Lingulodinium_polyedra.AAC.1